MRKLQFAACHPERRTVGSKSKDLLWILALAFTIALRFLMDNIFPLLF